jgi:hypothetical protein
MLALNFLQTLRAQPLSSEALSYSSYATLWSLSNSRHLMPVTLAGI